MPGRRRWPARSLALNVTSKSLGLPGLRIGWITCRDRDLLSRLERAKHYTTICNSAPSEVLARIAIKARATILHRNRALIARNLPLFDAFFVEHPDLFEWRAPDGGCHVKTGWVTDVPDFTVRSPPASTATPPPVCPPATAWSASSARY